ncbi:MAG: LysM peptidoglycan-binding domain-containing protein [Pseudomonadota bacterium]
MIRIFLLFLLFSLPLHAENFPRPVELERDVNFWLRVYTEINTRSGFIHDAYNLEVVYETVNVNGGPRSNRKKIKEVKDRYAKILNTLASGKRTNLSVEEKRVLSMWGDSVPNKRLKEAAGDLRFQRGQSNRFREGVIRSGEWREYINQTFIDLGMPVELSALPHVESSFNPNAYSHVGAAGMWQFIRSTGRRYMQIDYVVDERMDPFTSTIAAAKLLQHNYNITQSWPLALTAYNHGVASMRRAINKLGTRDIDIIVRQYNGRAFGFASRNFYVAFLAALEVDQNPEKYFGDLNMVKPYDYEIITLKNYIFVDDIADALGVKKSVIKQHNKSLLASIWNGNKRIPLGYKLRVPKNLLKEPANQSIASISSAQKFDEQTPDLFHYVVRGDTISEIAQRYGYSIRDVMAANGLRSGHYIRVGQKLRLPVKEQGVVLAQAKPIQEIKEPVEHVVNEKSKEKPVETAEVLEVEPTEQAKEETEKIALIDAEVLDQNAINKHNELAEEIEETDVNVVAEPEIDVTASPILLSDPADYTVADNETIEVQSRETLGHYAEWLDLRASQLRKINDLRFGEHVVIGRRLKLDFSRISREEFERRRVGYQKDLQSQFFAQYTIDATYEYQVKNGESLWVLALRKFKVPVWLLRQHNPDVNFDRIKPGQEIIVPILLEVKTDSIPS